MLCVQGRCERRGRPLGWCFISLIVTALFLGLKVARALCVFSLFFRALFGIDLWRFCYWRLVTEVAAGLLRMLGLKYAIGPKNLSFLVLQRVAQTQVAVLLSR